MNKNDIFPHLYRFSLMFLSKDLVLSPAEVLHIFVEFIPRYYIVLCYCKKYLVKLFHFLSLCCRHRGRQFSYINFIPSKLAKLSLILIRICRYYGFFLGRKSYYLWIMPVLFLPFQLLYHYLFLLPQLLCGLKPSVQCSMEWW